MTEREERDHDVMYKDRKKEIKDMYKVGGGITYDLYDLTGHNNRLYKLKGKKKNRILLSNKQNVHFFSCASAIHQ